MELNFPGVSLTRTAQLIRLHSAQLLTTLSSAVVGGGLVQTHTILNAHVDKNYDIFDPDHDLRRLAQTHGIEGSFVGLMTAVYLHKVQICTLQHEGLTVSAIITAGVGNATAAGLSQPVLATHGTINTILLIDAEMPAAALVNAVITATEAKSDVLRLADVRAEDGHLATGTSSDAIVVASTQHGLVCPYAGPATIVGWLLGRAVRQALTTALA